MAKPAVPAKSAAEIDAARRSMYGSNPDVENPKLPPFNERRTAAVRTDR